MTNNQYRIEFTSDLSRGITVTPIRFALLSNENMAHAFVIKTTRNGQKNDLTGSNVRAYFIPASQNLSVLIDGEVDQNGNAVIELTKDCYYYTGRFFLIIETEMDNVTSCIFYGDGYVTKTNTDEIVAPPETVGIISAVLYNKPQSLTDAQKQQARANIGAISEVDVPQKGVHYWTPADQESIVQQVIAALGTPVFGVVDENNNIILTGELADGTYTVKYEDAKGNVTEIGTIAQMAIINLIDTVGYQDGKRVNSSGEYVDADGYTSSGRISVTQGDVLRTRGINFDAADNGKCNIHVWEASGANQYFVLNSTSDLPKDTNHLSITIDDNNNLTVTIKSTAFVEITFTGYGSGADLIVTKNQEIA